MSTSFSSAETPREQHYRRGLITELSYELVPLGSLPGAVSALPGSSTVSITCSPVKGIGETMRITDQVRALGHRVTPHLSARLVESPEHVVAIARWLRSEAIDGVFIVGGDAEQPRGPHHDAFGFLQALLDAGPGLTTVGVTSYPDGHPVIGAEVLQQALAAKQALLAEAGLHGYAVTQLCFDPAKISNWLHDERQAGLTLPVHLGIAGAVDPAKLMATGMRLGVGASLRYLRKNRAAVGKLLTTRHYNPDELLGALTPVLEPYGITGLHSFTFNQVEATARWQHEAG